MKGYRTLTLNVLAMTYLIVGMLGFDIPLAEQEEITASVIVIANFVMRFFTSTEVGKA